MTDVRSVREICGECIFANLINAAVAYLFMSASPVPSQHGATQWMDGPHYYRASVCYACTAQYWITSVCLSVRPSRCCIVSKQKFKSSKFFPSSAVEV